MRCLERPLAYLHFMSCYEGFVKAVYSHAATATETHRTATGAICVHNLGYIGLDVHKKSISYRMKDASDQIYAEGTIPATRFDLDRWLKTLNSLNRPVTLLKSEAQYSQSFGEGRLSGSACRAAAIFRNADTSTGKWDGLRALLSNQRSVLARVGKTYNASLQICTCCSQSSRRKAHSLLTLRRNSCGG